jgi:hypothetical protein
LHCCFWQAFNNFVAVLSNDRIHLQDKSKLNSVLAGLGHCLSLVARATENDDASNRPVSKLNFFFFASIFFLPDTDGALMKNLMRSQVQLF